MALEPSGPLLPITRFLHHQVKALRLARRTYSHGIFPNGRIVPKTSYQEFAGFLLPDNHFQLTDGGYIVPTTARLCTPWRARKLNPELLPADETNPYLCQVYGGRVFRLPPPYEDSFSDLFHFPNMCRKCAATFHYYCHLANKRQPT